MSYIRGNAWGLQILQWWRNGAVNCEQACYRPVGGNWKNCWDYCKPLQVTEADIERTRQGLTNLVYGKMMQKLNSANLLVESFNNDDDVTFEEDFEDFY